MAALPGAFGVTQRAGRSRRVQVLRSQVVKCLAVQGVSVAAEEVSVLEVRCLDVDCPDLEVEIIIFEAEGRPRRSVRVRKPIADVSESDIKQVLSEPVPHDPTLAPEDAVVCSCCEDNHEKQLWGCGCCGWQLLSDGARFHAESGRRVEPASQQRQSESAEASSSSSVERRTQRIRVQQLMGGGRWEVEVDSTGTVGDMKAAIVGQGGPARDQQRLVLQGIELEDTRLVAELDLSSGAPVFMVPARRGT